MTPEADDVEVVPAGEDDAAAIRALPDLGDSTRRLLDLDLVRDDRCCLVARDADGPEGWAPGEGAVVGFASGLVALDEAHVLDLAVATERRRQGIGHLLLRRLLERVRARGAGGVTLEVRRSNDAALALYRRLGFVVEGERARYYPDGEDAILMWKRD